MHFTWFKYFTYHLLLVPDYKQHILSPAEVREICYSLDEIYVKSVYLILIGLMGRSDINKTF
jgi:hypothetical protein